MVGKTFDWIVRCATAALAALLPTLLLRARKKLSGPSSDGQTDLQPNDHASSSINDQIKDLCEDSKSDGLREEDAIRVLGVVDGKS